MIHWDRLIAIVGRITQKPETWDQTVYHCGTSHCVAGHAQLDMGVACNAGYAWYQGREWLGFTTRQAAYALDTRRTLAELQQLAITQKFPRIRL